MWAGLGVVRAGGRRALPGCQQADAAIWRRIRDNIVNSHVLTCIYRSQPLEFKHDVDEHFLSEVVRPKVSTYDAEGLKLSMSETIQIIPDELTCDTSLTKCLQSRQPFIGASLGWSIETGKLGGQKQYVAVCDYCGRDFTLG
ncbi:hypothetical protein ANCDUO_17373 [Ancylostoma duodenale]|uniref:Uncharacterized protein n=1 Tax=Ancylostoma duodenale TaxID=51022 RepID=A0A0C2G620_9BILA|nr:hypothetical protein ANCDUO_17373 [Ancylostoma duodenale]